MRVLSPSSALIGVGLTVMSFAIKFLVFLVATVCILSLSYRSALASTLPRALTLVSVPSFTGCFVLGEICVMVSFCSHGSSQPQPLWPLPKISNHSHEIFVWHLVCIAARFETCLTVELTLARWQFRHAVSFRKIFHWHRSEGISSTQPLMFQIFTTQFNQIINLWIKFVGCDVACLSWQLCWLIVESWFAYCAPRMAVVESRSCMVSHHEVFWFIRVG